MTAERAYVGKSSEGSLQGALDKALQLLDPDLGEDGVTDATASWVINEIAGEYGGIAAFHGVTVKITAKRIPPWEKR